MIKTATVLVLGAGASMPYKFPSGAKLKTKVLELLARPNLGPASVLRGLGFENDLIARFRDALLKSGQTSVDAFLEHRSEFLGVGKAAIACVLIQHENEATLFRVEPWSEDWYQILFSCMRARTADSFVQNNVTIVTFNYDRSLEHFFVTALSNSYGLAWDEAVDIVRKLSIIHVHGCLGNYPGFGDGARPYSPDVSGDLVRIAASGIRIMWEGQKHLGGFEAATQAIIDAQTVCFLGFGYHVDNLRRLGIYAGSGCGPNRSCYGTAFGLEAQDVLAVRQAFDGVITLGEAKEHVALHLKRTVSLA